MVWRPPADVDTTTRSSAAIRDLLDGDGPDDLMRFVADPALVTRLWSATESYLDLGDDAHPVDGGRLLHLVSDSQWVMHWSIYLGDDGRTAVVASDFPVGFRLPDEDVDFWSTEPHHYFLCASSFAEFVWRWWMDNEVFYRHHVEKAALTEPQLDYLRQYGEPQPLF